MGFCCPAVFLGGLMDKQNQLERIAWAERHRDGSMGIWWLAVGVVGIASSYIAAYVYDHYTKAKMQSDYLDCLNKYQTDYGMSPEDAAKICGQGGEGLKESITKTIKIVIYGGVAVMASLRCFKDSEQKEDLAVQNFIVQQQGSR